MTSSLPQSAKASSYSPLPPLENGDRLTQSEFEPRYRAMPELKKAELVEGVVYMGSPLRFGSHAEPHGRFITWLGVYQAATPHVQMGIEPTLRLDIDNEPQPDGVLLISPEKGDQAKFSEEGYVAGAPELVIEIAASSATIDLGDQKRAYRRSEVQEYLVWQVFDQKIDWFSWQNGDYITLIPDKEGIIHSRVFPGLWLDVPAMSQGNLQQVLMVLQTGINSPQHQVFNEQLEKFQ